MAQQVGKGPTVESNIPKVNIMNAIIAKLAVLIVVLMPTMGLVIWFMLGDIGNGGFVAIAAACVWLVAYVVVLSTDWKTS